jgi:hypothetical protein
MSATPPTDWRTHRARVAALSRDRRPNDPELLQAKRLLKQARLAEVITTALAKGPELSRAQRIDLVDLLIGERP